MSRDGAPKPEHVALAQQAYCPGSKYNTPEEGRAVERIAQAIADAEERGREAGIREAAKAVDARMARHTYGCDCNAGPVAKSIHESILALLDVKP